MISLDTNVLVRILVADDPAQTRQARALLRRLDGAGEKAHVSQVVFSGLVWVLAGGYGHDRRLSDRSERPLLVDGLVGPSL